jgi:hypothetical protein
VETTRFRKSERSPRPNQQLVPTDDLGNPLPGGNHDLKKIIGAEH